MRFKILRPVGALVLVLGVGAFLLTDSGGSLKRAWGWLRGSLSESPATPVQALSVQFVSDPQFKMAVEVRGLRPASLDVLRDQKLSNGEWAEILAVRAAESATVDNDLLPPMLGNYQIDDHLIRFTPRFAWVEGLTYTAHLKPALLAAKLDDASLRLGDQTLQASSFVAKPETAAPTLVTQVYPTGEELPANQLKLYIQFSAPMSRGEAFDRLHLVDEAGNQLPRTFLRLEDELWDESRTRLTVWFDPGRIKRGLRPNREFGAPLTAGRRYRLTIDRAWQDENGNPLGAGFEKAFAVVPSDRVAPRQQDWQLRAPEIGSREALTLQFAEPMDYALLESFIEVFDAQGNRVSGEVAIAQGEKAWQFTPTEAWGEGNYAIHINTALADRAGNSLRHLFDTDLQKPGIVSNAAGQAELVLPFTAKWAGGNP